MGLNYQFSDTNNRTYSSEIYYIFSKIVEGYLFFHLFSWAFITLLVGLTLVISNTSPRSITHGIIIASTIVVFFSYLTLKPFFEGKKYFQIEEMIRSQHENFKNKGGTSLWQQVEFHQNLKDLIRYHLQETFIIDRKPTLTGQIKLSYFWKFYLYAADILGKNCLKTLITLIENTPTDLKAHTEYANAILSQINSLKIPLDWHPYFLTSLIHAEQKDSMKKKIEKLYCLAVEELKIIDGLSPRDPWTHAKLADCYHDLKMHDLEIQEVEFLRHLRPNDKEILFKLGELYFSQKKYSEGIKIYDLLKIQDKELAQKLMSSFRIHQESHLN